MAVRSSGKDDIKDGLFLWKLNSNAARIETDIAVLNEISLICQFGTLEVWTINGSRFDRNKNICVGNKNANVQSLRFEKMLVLHFRGKPSHIKKLQVFHIGTNKGNYQVFIL